MSSVSTKSLPKIELHAHLNGSISLKTMQKLHNQNDGSEEDLKSLILNEPKTMDEVFKYFGLIHKLIQTKEALLTATMDVIREFNEDGVVYLELGTTPKKVGDMTKFDYIMTIHEALELSSDLPIVVRFILTIDRRQSVEEASEIVALAEQFAKKYGKVVGIGLAGDPSCDGQKFLPVLRQARHRGLKISIHLAELKNCLDEVDAMLQFGPDRIAHGSFLHLEDRWVHQIAKQKIPFEICLTSNILCMTNSCYAESHFSFWKNLDVPVVLCTDDKGLMDITLSGELQIAAKEFNLSEEDLKKMTRDAFNSRFLAENDPLYANIFELIK
ncbi:unnamed protein product [Auanema sp. JU1783]|nr:unnamed protein product [Auanema sp. JU1783]